MEQENQARLEGLCSHGNLPATCSMCAAEKEKDITTAELSPNKLEAITKYYQFEVDQGYWNLPENMTVERMAAYRQQQMNNQDLKVTTAKQGNELVGTAVVVLKNGTMGKEVQPNEAWAAGIVVDTTKRGAGIGEALVRSQEAIAKENGKDTMVTTIAKNNAPSMRLYFKSGYALDSVIANEGEDADYHFIKKLNDTAEQLEKKQLVEIPPIVSSAEDATTEQVLADPDDDNLVAGLLAKGYRGNMLLRPQDTNGSIDKNYLVLERQR